MNSKPLQIYLTKTTMTQTTDKQEMLIQGAFILLFFLVIVLYLIVKDNLSTMHDAMCNEHMLELIAPETLYPPESQWFASPVDYIEAYQAYVKNGTWATLEDGYKCKL